MRGLIIRSGPIRDILAGRKTWEIRGKRTHIRGTIGLIEKGTGTVVGLCEVVDCIGPLSLAEMRRNFSKHRIPLSCLRSREGNYKTIYAWVLKKAKPLSRPVKYTHKSGVIVWHPLPDSLLKRSK
ncbi:ASCH domain-containing protein [soil metagenome]